MWADPAFETLVSTGKVILTPWAFFIYRKYLTQTMANQGGGAVRLPPGTARAVFQRADRSCTQCCGMALAGRASEPRLREPQPGGGGAVFYLLRTGGAAARVTGAVTGRPRRRAARQAGPGVRQCRGAGSAAAGSILSAAGRVIGAGGIFHRPARRASSYTAISAARHDLCDSSAAGSPACREALPDNVLRMDRLAKALKLRQTAARRDLAARPHPWKRT